MAKVRFWCNSGANIHSTREDVLDTSDDLGIPDEEWAAMTDEDKQAEAESWAWQKLEIGYSEED